MHMGMAAADQHQILSDRNRLLHRLLMPQHRLEDEPHAPDLAMTASYGVIASEAKQSR
jgi:hypothetical protein